MARVANPGELERRKWERWLASCSASIREIAERLDPWTLYRIRSTGQRGLFAAVAVADGQPIHVALNVTPMFNLLLAGSEQLVIVPIEELEPCPLPAPGERVGLLDVEPNFGGGITLH